VDTTQIDFKTIATDAISRGFAVIPLLPGKKDPDMTLVPRVNNVVGTGGAVRRTRDLTRVALWAECSANANIGVCSDDVVTILETDDEAQFRQLVRNVSRSIFGDARELPDTLTSQARPNRPHFFFLATDKTRAVEGAPGIQGLFEWRRENQYVVGPGSLHPTGVVYRIVNDTPMVPMPDWLVDVLLEVRLAYRGQTSRVSNYVRVGPAAIAKEALLNNYALDPHLMLEDAEFELHVPAGERHYFLQAMVGLLHDGERDADELEDILMSMRDRYCEAGKGDYEIKNLVSWTLAQKPYQGEPNLPIYCKGGVIYKSKEAMDAAPDPVVNVADELIWRYPRIKGDICQYVMEPTQGKEYNGWFPRGSVSLIAGGSGSGKSTFMLNMLHKQTTREYILGHRGAGLRYLVLFADRGALSNRTTLKRMGLENAGVNIDYIGNASNFAAIDAIKNSVENFEEHEMPQAVFVEGADLLVSKLNESDCVGQFMLAMQRLAEHYHVALVLSVGAPKSNKQTGPTARRDMVVGSQMWGRTAETVCVMTSDGDGTSGLRKFTAQHRNEATEEFTLEFKNGLLVQVEDARNGDPVMEWLLSQEDWFTRNDAVEQLKEAGAGIGRTQILEKVKELLTAGKLIEVMGTDRKFKLKRKDK
jgi:energy-coupling factor transporter ATP-binding protein EcfA2